MSSIYSLGGGEASNAVNGITTGIWDDGSCASTDSEQSPWMTVDLGDVYTVSAVVIINRLDSYGTYVFVSCFATYCTFICSFETKCATN